MMLTSRAGHAGLMCPRHEVRPLRRHANASNPSLRCPVVALLGHDQRQQEPRTGSSRLSHPFLPFLVLVPDRRPLLAGSPRLLVALPFGRSRGVTPSDDPPYWSRTTQWQLLSTGARADSWGPSGWMHYLRRPS